MSSPRGIGSPVYGGLVEVNRGQGSPAILNPVTLLPPGMNRSVNNNPASPRSQSRRPTSPSEGLFPMEDHPSSRLSEEEEEEEELEDLADTGNCSPFEAVECSDLETDPDDNSQEDLRREGGGLSFVPASQLDKERKYSKYSTSAPMNIAGFPQLNRGAVGAPLDEVEAAEEEEDRIHGAMEEQAAAAPEPDPAQIAASMQALAMSHRDEDDPEALFGERPRRRLNTLELYQIRQFKKPTNLSNQNTANPSGLNDEGFSSSGLSGSGF